MHVYVHVRVSRHTLHRVRTPSSLPILNKALNTLVYPLRSATGNLHRQHTDIFGQCTGKCTLHRYTCTYMYTCTCTCRCTFAYTCTYTDLPSEVILMREISAGVPMNDPIAPAVTPESQAQQVHVCMHIDT